MNLLAAIFAEKKNYSNMWTNWLGGRNFMFFN